MTPRWFHQPYEPFAYALAETRARLVVQVEARSVADVLVEYGDRYLNEFTGRARMRRTGTSGKMAYYAADVTIPTHRLKYAFVLHDRSGKAWHLGELGTRPVPHPDNVFQLAYLCTRDIYSVPDWVGNAVCYQVFPDRFARRHDAAAPARARYDAWDGHPKPASVFGGDLAGLMERLPYLHQLGVSLLYLTPIFKSPSNHKYDTEDYFETDPQFGTNEDLRRLVEQAHALGIRVVLDAVFNHAGNRFRPFLDVLAHGRASRYWDWFFIQGDEVRINPLNYETFANQIPSMPKLNVAHPEVEQYLLHVAQYWIREFQIDGWRLDVANEIDHVFWRKFRAAVKAADRNALIIGEVWHNGLPWLRGDQFDGVMNYPLRQLALSFFLERSMDAPALAESLVGFLHQYPEPATRAMFNLLGNHDTARALTLAGGDEVSVILAMVFQFTMPGIPMLYYGDEVGMQGGPDPDCRRGMVWETGLQNTRIQSAVRSLAALKRTLPAFAGANLEVVRAEGRVMEFIRWSEPTDPVHVVVNDGDAPTALSRTGQVLFSSRPGAVTDGWLQRRCAVIFKP